MTLVESKSQELEKRTIKFSQNVVTFCKTHQKDHILQPMLKQLIRSATSIGANYAEANNASSAADFKHKIFICKKEAAETKYWLNVLESQVEVSDLKNQTVEFLKIFQKIISTME